MARGPTLTAPAGAGGSLFSGSGGKPSQRQTLAPGEKTTLTPGETLSRSMGQYGKGHSYMTPEMEGPTAVGLTSRRGVTQIRGSSGGIRRNPRQGGFGPAESNSSDTEI